MRNRVLLASAILGALVIAAAYVRLESHRVFDDIERVPFNPTAAREQLAELDRARPIAVPREDPAETTPSQPVEEPTAPEVASPPPTEPTIGEVGSSASAEPQPMLPTGTNRTVDADSLDVFLILGSDERKEGQEDIRADTIMLLIVPEDRSSSMLVSIPRYLYVTSPCTGKQTRININLNGCGEVSGLDLLAVAVEDYTGLEVDHAILFGFKGFKTVVNRIGGVEVCVERAVKTHPDGPVLLEPGCSILDGGEALQWVRSRRTLELVDGEWQLMEHAGDSLRTARQREIVRQVMDRAEVFESRAALSSLVRALGDSFALDDGFELDDAIDLAWDLRSLTGKPHHDISIDATAEVAPNGKLVLVPDRPFSTYLSVLDLES